MLITCLLWFLPIHSYAILQYSGIFPQRVRSHCQGKQNQKFPGQCDPNSLTMSLGIFPNTVKLHNSEKKLLGKNHCKQVLNIFLPINHTGVDIASLIEKIRE